MALRAGALVAVGFALYYGLQAADQAVIAHVEQTAPDAAEAPVVELPPQLSGGEPSRAADGPGNRVLRSALVKLNQRQSLGGVWRQVGVVNGRTTQLEGLYQQAGAGDQCRFRLELTGRLAGQPTRLVRVSNSRFLWTDLTWGPDAESLQRSVDRVDLRRVRRALAEQAGQTGAAESWTRFGGAPMLLSGLDEAFAFGEPRRMRLGEELVVAMIGRWRETESRASTDRAPHHVVVALEDQGLLPRLVEYRGQTDPLSAAGLTDPQRLHPSRQPLLRLELGGLRPGVAVDPSAFVYNPPEDDWTDRTDREVQLAEQRKVATAVASTTTGATK